PSSISYSSSALTTTFYHADGNGNVTCLIYTNQICAAKYLYDPFGNSLSATGPLAFANRYRFSSKPIHEISGLYDFLHRWYMPNLQRWVNRDPIGEMGGLNLYSYLANDPLDKSDAFGEADPPKDKPPLTSPPVFGDKPFKAGTDNCLCYALDI